MTEIDEGQKQRVYEEFVLTYLRINNKAVQSDMVTDIRNLFRRRGLGDPGVPDLRRTIEDLIAKKRIVSEGRGPTRRLLIAY